jgi:DNA-binding transcriptional LysR family regulator
MLDLRRLRLLRELDVRGTVGAVAHAVSYTPSAVSQQLAVLEREAGVPLLERAGRNVRLTDAGRVLVRHADALLAGVESAEAELAALGGRVAGTVRVATFQTGALHLVAPALRSLAREHPDVRVEVAEAELEDALPALRLQAVDLLLGDEYEGLPRARPSGCEREDLLHERIRLVLPATHPLAHHQGVPITQLADTPWVATQPGTGHRELVIRVCRERGGFDPDLRHRSNDLLLLLELVRSAGAATLLPDLVGMRDDDDLAVRELAEGQLHRTVFALTRGDGAERPALAAFRAAVRTAADSLNT